LQYIGYIVGEEMMNTRDNCAVNLVDPSISTNVPSLMDGGYTSLLLGLDQEALAA
jgi:hypothetical protein